MICRIQIHVLCQSAPSWVGVVERRAKNEIELVVGDIVMFLDFSGLRMHDVFSNPFLYAAQTRGISPKQKMGQDW